MASSYVLPRVLVVDDEAMVRRALARALAEAGYRVRQAASGMAALDLLRDEPAEVLLTDPHMNGMSGAELIVSARAPCCPAYGPVRRPVIATVGRHSMRRALPRR